MAYRLAILTPTGGNPSPHYVQSLWDMHEALRFDKLVSWDEDQSVMYRLQEGSVLPQNRESLIIEAIRNGATHALFVDDDMTFSVNALRIMANRRLPLVAANYPQRNFPMRWTAKDMDGGQIMSHQLGGVTEADYAGLGFCLIDLEILAGITPPWFEFQYKTPENAYLGEDVTFARKARAAGFPCMVDNEASRHLGHLGTACFSWQMFKRKEEDTGEPVEPVIDPRKPDPMTLLEGRATVPLKGSDGIEVAHLKAGQ